MLRHVFQRTYNLRRKLFGTYAIQNPQSTAASAPYTYYLPPQDFLDALAEGDVVKIIVQSIPSSRQYDSERMWVIVTAREGEAFKGTLNNQPFDIPQLEAGDPLAFSISDIIDIDWDDEDLARRSLTRLQKKSYWERCLVDSVVLNASIPVEYIYRETADMGGDNDKYPDSGWRIRGNVKMMTQEQIETEDVEYIALGKVLNADDSWLHLIDSPVGSRFIKDEATGEFLPETED